MTEQDLQKQKEHEEDLARLRRLRPIDDENPYANLAPTKVVRG